MQLHLAGELILERDAHLAEVAQHLREQLDGARHLPAVVGREPRGLAEAIEVADRGGVGLEVLAEAVVVLAEAPGPRVGEGDGLDGALAGARTVGVTFAESAASVACTVPRTLSRERCMSRAPCERSSTS